jgi:hypothetical protein
MTRRSGIPVAAKLARIAGMTMLLAALAGCAQMSREPNNALATPAPDPSGYSWANEYVQGSGRAAAPKNTQTAQRDLAARNAARIAALKDLQMQMMQLPVGTDYTVGAIMDNYLNVRRAIEKQLQRAETLSEEKVGAEYEVRVKAPLAPIAQILRQSYITPTEELPKPPVLRSEGQMPIS